MTTMKNLMSLRPWVLLAAAVAVMSALALGLGNAASAQANTAPLPYYRYQLPANCSSPTVTQMSPQDAATGVSRNADVKVTFSEEMDPSTVNTNTFQLHFYDNYPGSVFFYTEPIPARVSKDPTDATGRTFLLDPYDATSTSLLSANRKYRVTVTTGVRDLEDGFLPPTRCGTSRRVLRSR